MNKRLREIGKFFIGFVFLISIDIATKLFTYFYIPQTSWIHPFYPFGGIGVFRDFFGISLSFNYVKNMGAAWGIFSHYPFFLFYIRIAIIIFLIGYLFFKRSKTENLFPFLLILAGAVGNILDTIIYGHVIDMIHFRFGSFSFPVFNCADIFICSGILLMAIYSFVKGKKGWKAATTSS